MEHLGLEVELTYLDWPVVSQLLQLLGAAMILAGFVAGQLRLLDARSYPYLLLNLVGSALLAFLAYDERQWGFLLLEAVWALVSLWSLGSRLLERTRSITRQ